MVKDSGEDTTASAPPARKPFDFLIKVVINGAAQVGKTSLLHRYANGKYQDTYIATIGVDFIVKEIQTKDGDTVKLQAWDLAGEERFRTITNSYYRGAMGMMLVYDVTDKQSFEHLEKLLDQTRSFGAEDIILFVVGNKADHNDSKRMVTFEEGKQFADENGLNFMETSARDNVSVNEAFEQFLELVVEKYKKDRANAAKSGPKAKPSKAKPELKAVENQKKSSTCIIL
ncbi:hypothetical protein EGW08_003942 [Elysia chlorotica]|uniref:Small monomeric GTPase n=1 Tax=Elysia chlorotica TaxID=188477 RepID=A0A433U3B0_ELYCH|nr:hypothetical protein EGW08_003942 [Elysia chlorotica]